MEKPRKTTGSSKINTILTSMIENIKEAGKALSVLFTTNELHNKKIGVDTRGQYTIQREKT